jgi:rhodanese-related sulfurtransferase
MNLISREELKARLDRKDDFTLLIALGELAYQAKHIPGSIYSTTPGALLERLDENEDIVVYCSNPTCIASIAVYKFLENHGYRNIRRYAGGLEDWEAAGLPLEGEMISEGA